MSEVPVQKGETVFLGYGDYTYALILTDDATISPIADVATIPDEHNATTTVLVYNPGQHIDISGVILGDSFPSILLIGGSITINAVVWRIEKYDIKLARTEAKLTLSAIKEDGMTYSA